MVLLELLLVLLVLLVMVMTVQRCLEIARSAVVGDGRQFVVAFVVFFVIVVVSSGDRHGGHRRTDGEHLRR